MQKITKFSKSVILSNLHAIAELHAVSYNYIRLCHVTEYRAQPITFLVHVATAQRATSPGTYQHDTGILFTLFARL